MGISSSTSGGQSSGPQPKKDDDLENGIFQKIPRILRKKNVKTPGILGKKMKSEQVMIYFNFLGVQKVEKYELNGA